MFTVLQTKGKGRLFYQVSNSTNLFVRRPSITRYSLRRYIKRCVREIRENRPTSSHHFNLQRISPSVLAFTTWFSLEW